MQVNIGGKQVPITPAAGIELTPELFSKLLGFAPFREYCTRLAVEPRFVVRSITLQSVDMFGARGIGFVKVKADVVDSNGKPIPGVAFLRGGSVGILVILTCAGEEYAVLVRQARSPVGKFDLPELPAGMLDGSGQFAGVAATEMKEELHLTIRSDDLVDLTAMAFTDGDYPGLYASPGGSDEFFRLFLYRQEVADIAPYQNRKTGAGADETIHTQVVPLQTCWRNVPDAKLLTALFLYEQFRMGKIN